MGEPGYWIGSLQNLKFGRGYWLLTDTDLPNFNWMGFGNDTRGAVADFEKVNFNLTENWYENNTPIEILNKLKNQLGMETQFTPTNRNDDCECSCYEAMYPNPSDMPWYPVQNSYWGMTHDIDWCCGIEEQGDPFCFRACCGSGGGGGGTGRIDKRQRIKPEPIEK